jgi:DNA replication protein DnaC
MLFNEARIPAIMHAKTIETYREMGGNQAIVKLNMMRYMQGFPPPKNKGLLLWGGTGVGKTHLVCSLARLLTLNMGHSVAYTTFEDTVPLFRQAIMDGESVESIMPALVSADCFILEDIGEGTISEFRLHCLDMCISARYNAGKPLIVTTRFAPEAQDEKISLKERVGERVFSRLCEMCQFLEVFGPDYRRRSGALMEEM